MINLGNKVVECWIEESRLLTQACCRGQYSDAVLNELESQNDGQVEGILGKVRQLKEVNSLSRSGLFKTILTW
jgi:hypothetical protein